MTTHTYENAASRTSGTAQRFLSRPVTLFALTSALLFASPAHAYLDAGTGSMILQMILGAIAAAAVAGRLYWHRLKLFLGIEDHEIAETESPASAVQKEED